MHLTFQQAQKNISEIANRRKYNKDVMFELLAAYGRSESSIAKLRNGVNNLAEDKDNEILQRNIVYFKYNPLGKLLPTIEKLNQNPLVTRYNPRYLIVTDYIRLAAIDTKKNTTLDIKLHDLDRHVDFFYGWTGDEITDEKTEAVADRRAAEKMTELYAEIEKINKNKFNTNANNFRHDLNVFFSRLLFCFFAEDTKVFSKSETGMFTNAIKDFTQINGSDLDGFLGTLFESFDQQDKSKYTSPFSNFPYVNGGLFSTDKKIQIPKFSPQARKTIIECGSLQWSEINPDIFGSMFQGVVDDEYRSEHQMHYTSVPNIMKTIEPLFLDELREEFDKNFDNPNKLIKLHDRISKIKVFDPACGSGNFLVIAYKALRKIEHAILERLMEGKLQVKLTSRITLDNFYGIEIDDFACEIAILSLHIAKHQMNIEFEKQFGKEIELIPLIDVAKIVHGNAARLDWNEICSNKPHFVGKTQYDQTKLIADVHEQASLLNDEDLKRKVWDEIYLISNPPYQGARLQDKEQKRDFEFAYVGKEYSKNLDYISIWFIKGAEYISGTKARLAFVSTNSICQGEHTALLWPDIYDLNIEIGFAYTSFKWTNSARNQAGVICIIVGLRNVSRDKKFLYDNLIKKEVDNINAYLIPSEHSTILTRRAKPLSDIPPLTFGSMPNDGGYLILNIQERNALIATNPELGKFIKKFIGAEEFLRGTQRWTIWITNDKADEAMQSQFIRERVQKVADIRAKSKRTATKKLKKFPYRFGEIRYTGEKSILVPEVSSENREYMTIGFVDNDTVISNRAFSINKGELWLFAIISSRLHMIWTKAVTGRLKTDINYSSTIVYNNFPIPQLTDVQKKNLALKAQDVLFKRENHTEMTLAVMYDPDKMPEDLRKAHHELDLTVDRLYRYKPYENNEERLSDLFALYEKMTAHKKEKSNA